MNELTTQKKQHYTIRATSCLKRMAQDIIELSQIAHEYREEFGHQEYVEWITEELKISKRQGHNLLSVYEKFGVSANFALTDFAPSALYLLSQDSTPESARQESIELAESGETVTHAKAKEIADAHKEIERLKKELADKDEFFTAQHNEPTTYPLIPQIQELLDRQKIMPAKAKILQTMSEEGQGVWFTEYLQKFSAENQLTEQKAKVKALESQPQPKAEVIEKIIEKIPEDYEKLKKSVTEKTKIENRLKETESKLGSVSEKKTELQKEVDKLKAQLEVDTPTNIDNARALKMEREVKNLNWLFPDIKAEAKLAGGEMHETKKVIIEIIKLWSSLLQELDGQEIIELKR